MLNKRDLEQIQAKGISEELVNKQIENFKNGFPTMRIVKPARIGDGIKKVNENEFDSIIAIYEEQLKKKKLVKFVPASGAATRMFKDLYDFINKVENSKQPILDILSDTKFCSVNTFIQNIDKFAFFNDLKDHISQKGVNIYELLNKSDYVSLLKFLLEKEGLNYGNLPKALLKFHKYNTGSRASIEEHLVEGAKYAKNEDNTVNLHFTVSNEHRIAFEKYVNDIKHHYENIFKVTYIISYSEQESSTDTIAVNLLNEPFREEDGTLLFRPGGHGALLTNLNRLDADCILIKNIDNVTVDKFLETTILYKKLLAGILFQVQDKIHGYLHKIEKTTTINSNLLNEIIAFYENELCTKFPISFLELSAEKKRDYIFEKLNRPIRTCGMVKSEGDTGGGPFWSENNDHSISLQVVETAQINLNDPKSKEIFDGSTHFSPADFALSIKDYKGNKFNLMNYRDPSTGFIAKKSKNGKDLKAQELPGLWNGSMSDWNTVLIEVPIITFNPVKSIIDLLEEEHMG